MLPSLLPTARRSPARRGAGGILRCLALAVALGGGARLAPSARALTAQPRDFGYLVGQAELIFKGTVEGRSARWVGAGQERRIATFVRFRVLESLKGDAGAEQELEFLGGHVGAQRLVIPEMPRFEPGETHVLFVVANHRQVCPLVGLDQGAFRVKTDPRTGQESIYTHHHTPLVNLADLGRTGLAGSARVESLTGPDAQPISADEFRNQIVAKVRELAAVSPAAPPPSASASAVPSH